MLEARRVQCDECDGAGEFCTRCKATPDNCGCESPTYADETFRACETCGGDGEVDYEERG